ncbi:hypothetical protein LM595_00085 [Candidatus Acetothermia bacterium]|jgi:hypothetical protein|nr:hypothetical protein [Candidatus Acetothermia bacterium]
MDVKERLQRVVREEFVLHPQMTPADLQKLIYQAVFGCDHLLTEPQRFHQELKQEWKMLPPITERRINPLQVIDPAGRTARLHLQPCKELGIEFDALCTFLLLQPLKEGSPERFTLLWNNLRQLAQEKAIPFALHQIAVSSPTVHPCHHSLEYGFTSYRVVNDITNLTTATWLKSVARITAEVLIQLNS